MAKTITIKLTGLAEKFIDEMKNQGLTEADVISQGLGMLEQVWRTNRVGLIKEDFYRNAKFKSLDDGFYNEDRILEYYFHIQTPYSMNQERKENSSTSTNL